MKLLVFANLYFIISSVSSEDIFLVWIFMELSSITFMIILSSAGSLIHSISGYKFVVFQMISSSLFLMAFIYMKFLSVNYCDVIFLVILFKTGTFPFIGWATQMLENQEWWKVQLFGTLQKVVPLVVLSNLECEMADLLVLMSSFVWLMIWQTSSLRTFLLMSSSMNFSWMCCVSQYSVSVLVLFFLIYSAYQLQLVFFLQNWHSTSFDSLFHESRSESFMKTVTIVFLLLASAGFPPFGLFFMKLESIDLLICSSSLMSSFVLSLGSIVLSGIYLYVVLPLVMSGSPRFSFLSGGVDAYTKGFSLCLWLGVLLLPVIVMALKS